MELQLNLETGNIWCRKILEVDCPNKFGGIGNITIIPDSIWTGCVHLKAEKVAFNISGIKSIQTRSNLDETDEKWVTIWKVPVGNFEYESYFELAKIIKNIKL